MKDPYFKLRPEPVTPENGFCNCEHVPEIYLAHKLGVNPLYCLRCNGEVLPDKLAFSEYIAEGIASWNSVYGSIYRLWLDSGEYGQWARERLLDTNGQVNLDGLDLVKQLGSFAKTYYLWFYENDDAMPQKCPLCSGNLTEREGRKSFVCNKCLIIL